MYFFSNKSYIQAISITVIASLIIISSITGFYSLPQIYYYGSLFAFGFLALFFSHQKDLGMKLLWVFVIICAVTIYLNQPPPFFKAWQRWCGFFSILLIVSPMIISEKSNEIREQLFVTILWICIFLSFLSFFCYYLGINYFKRSDELSALNVGVFSGLFSHSMLLGPISGLSSIYTFSLFLNKGHRSYWLLFLTICCIGSTLLSASRGAVVASIFGLIITYICYFRENLYRSLFIAILVIIVIAITFPLWDNITELLIAKQEKNIQSGGTFMSREHLWMARIAEIRKHPFTGVGFCCVDTKLTSVNTKTGIIEPGSSWLAVFSMTGLFGFVTFLTIFYMSALKAYKRESRIESSILCGFLSFFAIHFLTEGYVLASGSFLGLIFWLLIGCVWGEDNKTINH